MDGVAPDEAVDTAEIDCPGVVSLDDDDTMMVAADADCKRVINIEDGSLDEVMETAQ